MAQNPRRVSSLAEATMRQMVEQSIEPAVSDTRGAAPVALVNMDDMILEITKAIVRIGQPGQPGSIIANQQRAEPPAGGRFQMRQSIKGEFVMGAITKYRAHQVGTISIQHDRLLPDGRSDQCADADAST